MVAGAKGRAQDIVANGKISVIPGFGVADTGRNLDEPIFSFDSGLVVTGAATTIAGDRKVAPCDLEIVGAHYTKLDGEASKTMNFGTTADVDAFLDDFVMATAAGSYDIPASAFTSTSIAKGDVLQFNSASIASTNVYMTVLAVPRNG